MHLGVRGEAIRAQNACARAQLIPKAVVIDEIHIDRPVWHDAIRAALADFAFIRQLIINHPAERPAIDPQIAMTVNARGYIAPIRIDGLFYDLVIIPRIHIQNTGDDPDW